MEDTALDFTIERLGECSIPSPLDGVRFVSDAQRVLYHDSLEEVKKYIDIGKELPAMEVAGARKKIFFDPSSLGCGIVTCGGLCPGLNDVIRAVAMSLIHHYGVKRIYGFQYGFEGLVARYGHEPIELDLKAVAGIKKLGGTFLGSSRGPQEVSEMVDTLERMKIGVLFTIGGDGTLRGACAINEEIKRRGLKIAVIGIPKTIDNDISFIDRSFGFLTAGSEARKAIASAHSEASGAINGVGLVKLMGRDSGFIAAYAVLADNEVNFCLIPEIPFSLDVFLDALEKRLIRRGHAVIVVAEGAGQHLLGMTQERDASGNIRYNDIGIFLREKIKEHFKKIGMELNLKYIDPSYIIRSVPADASDAAFCLLLGHNAVHAGMTGRTNMVVGNWHNEYTHVPISLAVSKRKKIDPDGRVWSSVRAATGQPVNML
ncbi:MAG TPA: ATP-dependent 6-phosphofructokinase [Syntrophorhabdaceae bacterium]|jgi:6-phosphofructokinase 1|nr:ATP-dependent 6-phosphofructokinase [Syntrophorhabdaceae bacterium]